MSGEVKIYLNSESDAKSFEIAKVNARDVEEAFKIVRTHLEGNDHSVRFPNHQNGAYQKLNSKVLYRVYGHPYSADEIWKPKQLPTRTTNQEMIEVDTEHVIYSGNLKKLTSHFPSFLRKDTWDEAYFEIKYPKLIAYKHKGDEKPLMELELRVEKEDEDDDDKDKKKKDDDKDKKKDSKEEKNEEKKSDAKEEEAEEKKEFEEAETALSKEADNAFEVRSGDGDWILQASNYSTREAWMSWLNAAARFDPKKFKSEQERKKAKRGSLKREMSKETVQIEDTPKQQTPMQTADQEQVPLKSTME